MMYATIRAISSDKDGNFLKDYGEKTANSLLKNFIVLLASQMLQGSFYGKNTAGNAYWDPPDANHFQFPNNWRGIRVGSSSTPVTLDDYRVTDVSPSAGAHSFGISFPNPNTCSLSIARTFTNGSVTPIQVREVGWYSGLWSNVNDMCIERTLYTAVIPASGGTLTITYRIFITI